MSSLGRNVDAAASYYVIQVIEGSWYHAWFGFYLRVASNALVLRVWAKLRECCHLAIRTVYSQQSNIIESTVGVSLAIGRPDRIVQRSI